MALLRGVQELFKVPASPPQAIGQNSPAALMTLAMTGTGRRGPARARRAKPQRAAARRAKPKRTSSRRSSSKRPARLVKGSAAAKRYMASIRRKRK